MAKERWTCPHVNAARVSIFFLFLVSAILLCGEVFAFCTEMHFIVIRAGCLSKAYIPDPRGNPPPLFGSPDGSELLTIAFLHFDYEWRVSAHLIFPESGLYFGLGSPILNSVGTKRSTFRL